MTLATEVKSMYNHTKEIYDSLEALGATLPENKNLESLATAFDSLPTTPPYDPSNPSLSGLKAALDAGDYSAFPAGTEIPDEYNGQSNPLIVAQYLDSTNNSSYGGAEGVILVRKWVEPINQAYGAAPYENSLVKTLLETTYFDNCSATIKSLISDIDIVTSSTSITPTKVKWFLMSVVELGGVVASSQPIYGIFWDYWKQQTSLISPTNNLVAARGGHDRDGNSIQYFLRPGTSSSYDYNQEGALKTGGSNMVYQQGVLPACFIAKSVPQDEPLTSAQYDALDLTAQTYDNYDLTAEQYDTNGKNLLK